MLYEGEGGEEDPCKMEDIGGGGAGPHKPPPGYRHRPPRAASHFGYQKLFETRSGAALRQRRLGDSIASCLRPNGLKNSEVACGPAIGRVEPTALTQADHAWLNYERRRRVESQRRSRNGPQNICPVTVNEPTNHTALSSPLFAISATTGSGSREVRKAAAAEATGRKLYVSVSLFSNAGYGRYGCGLVSLWLVATTRGATKRRRVCRVRATGRLPLSTGDAVSAAWCHDRFVAVHVDSKLEVTQFRSGTSRTTFSGASHVEAFRRIQ
ncbi:hypothetical protein ISCGN_031632 [Ixodes scapularis]